MSERFVRECDPAVGRMVASLDRGAFLRRLTSLLYHDDREPCDVSLVPLVLSAGEHARYEHAAGVLCGAALDAFCARRTCGGPGADPVETLLLGLPVRERILCGNARIDFLEEGDQIRLVEINFVGVGTTGHSHQPAVALLETLPSLKSRYRCLHPVTAFREQLVRNDIRTVALLTKDDDRAWYGSWLDRLIIARGLRPIRTFIVPRARWRHFHRADGRLVFHRTPIDAIYPRELTWRESIEQGGDWIRFFLESGARCLDHWGLVLVEDKDLRFLADHRPEAARFLPRTWPLGACPPDVDLASCVLKRRHVHAGDGVEVAPTSLPGHDDGSCILQERIRMNRTHVRSLFGFEGVVSYDVAAHVSWEYDTTTRSLRACTVSGYLSRFAPAGDIVNISRGGGVIPVLVEREA